MIYCSASESFFVSRLCDKMEKLWRVGPSLFLNLLLILVTPNATLQQMLPFPVPTAQQQIYKLTQLNVDPKSVTIAGFSSGGAQAMQFHISHSSKLLGAGIFSGVPYMSAHDRSREDFFVHEPEKFNVTELIGFARSFAENNLVDDLSYLSGSFVYVYHGKRDSVIHSGCKDVIEQIYMAFNANVYSITSNDSEHGMPSDNSGGPCEILNLSQNLVNKCGYNGPYNMYNYIYGGTLLRPEGTVGTVPLTGKFHKFDQSEFFPNSSPQAASMDKVGFLYIPSGCSIESSSKRCRFSIVLHGCLQDRLNYGEKFPRSTGFLEVGELNDIIMLFPQTTPSFLIPRNPQSCWDWWGYTNKTLYATRLGKQINAIKLMMDRISGE